MEIPIRFPDERKEKYEAAAAFQRLSSEEKMAAIFDLISLGASMMQESPHKEAMKRLQEAHEAAWQKAQKELFARHGL